MKVFYTETQCVTVKYCSHILTVIYVTLIYLIGFMFSESNLSTFKSSCFICSLIRFIFWNACNLLWLFNTTDYPIKFFFLVIILIRIKLLPTFSVKINFKKFIQWTRNCWCFSHHEEFNDILLLLNLVYITENNLILFHIWVLYQFSYFHFVSFILNCFSWNSLCTW